MENLLIYSTTGDVPVELNACLVQVEASKEWFTRRVLPLSIEQLRWRPDPGRWSIAECLDHLNLTFRFWLPKVSVATTTGQRQLCSSDHRPRYAQSEIDALKLVEPPVTAPVQAPPILIPSAAVDPDMLVDHFHQCRDHYAEAVRRAHGLDLPRIPIAEPIAPSINSLGAALVYLAAHERRHLWQSERVRNGPRFPRGRSARE